MNLKTEVRRYMEREVQGLNPHDINPTQLAENAAHAFDQDNWLDDETHWVWDLAISFIPDDYL